MDTKVQIIVYTETFFTPKYNSLAYFLEAWMRRRRPFFYTKKWLQKGQAYLL